MTVHQELGHGFLEAVYQEALKKEFIERKIPFKSEIPITIYYKDKPLNKCYIADFICYDEIIVELKALSSLKNDHRAQLINYLTATRLEGHAERGKEIARNLLADGSTTEFVQKMTGLDLETIQGLAGER